jgi:hypothetical protein
MTTMIAELACVIRYKASRIGKHCQLDRLFEDFVQIIRFWVFRCAAQPRCYIPWAR